MKNETKTEKPKNVGISAFRKNLSTIWGQAAHADKRTQIINAKRQKPLCIVRQYKEGDSPNISVELAAFRANIAGYFDEIADGKSILLTPRGKERAYMAILVPVEQ